MWTRYKGIRLLFILRVCVRMSTFSFLVFFLLLFSPPSYLHIHFTPIQKKKHIECTGYHFHTCNVKECQLYTYSAENGSSFIALLWFFDAVRVNFGLSNFAAIYFEFIHYKRCHTGFFMVCLAINEIRRF